jgi:DNA-binding transcriptional ArsR family regulator
VHLRGSLARVAIDSGDLDEAMRQVQAAEAIAAELGMGDALVLLRGMRSRVLIEQGDPTGALLVAREASGQVHAGVDQAYLVPFWHYRAAAVAGAVDEAKLALERAHDLLDAALAGVSRDQRTRAINRVPEMAAISAAWNEMQPQRVEVRLPVATAPTGRPLRDDEWVDVTWTLEEPADSALVGAVERRRHRLLRLLDEAADQGAAPTVDDLADALGVGQATVRRDLGALRQQGHRAKTRGSRRPRR